MFSYRSSSKSQHQIMNRCLYVLACVVLAFGATTEAQARSLRAKTKSFRVCTFPPTNLPGPAGGYALSQQLDVYDCNDEVRDGKAF